MMMSMHTLFFFRLFIVLLIFELIAFAKFDNYLFFSFFA